MPNQIQIPIPTRLRNPHPVVAATRRHYETARPDEDGRIRPPRREGIAHLIVSKAALRRALLYLQAICAEADRRGYEVLSSRGHESTGIAIAVRGHAYPLSIHELHDRVPLTAAEQARWRHRREWQLRWDPGLKQPTEKSIPNGYLKLVSRDWHGGRSSWSEGPRGPLERKLLKFFDALERRADDDDHRAKERNPEAETRRQRERDLARRRELSEIEQARARRLEDEVRLWRLTVDTRSLVAALRDRLGSLNDETPTSAQQWCDWAERWAEQHDATSNPAGLHGRFADLDQRARGLSQRSSWEAK